VQQGARRRPRRDVRRRLQHPQAVRSVAGCRPRLPRPDRHRSRCVATAWRLDERTLFVAARPASRSPAVRGGELDRPSARPPQLAWFHCRRSRDALGRGAGICVRHRPRRIEALRTAAARQPARWAARSVVVPRPAGLDVGRDRDGAAGRRHAGQLARPTAIGKRCEPTKCILQRCSPTSTTCSWSSTGWA